MKETKCFECNKRIDKSGDNFAIVTMKGNVFDLGASKRFYLCEECRDKKLGVKWIVG